MGCLGSRAHHPSFVYLLLRRTTTYGLDLLYRSPAT
jgi:hypothetical protein